MWFDIYLHSNQLFNDSATVWDNLDSQIKCKGYEGGSYIWAACTILCFALGLPTSIAILFEMFKMQRRGTPVTPNIFFTVNLSIMDVVFLVFIPLGMLNHYIWSSWVFGTIWNSVYALNVCGRPLLMACVCLDCYLAVVHPITYRKRKSLTPRVVMAGIAWTLTVACGIAFSLFDQLYYSMFSTVPFIIAMVIIGICDSLILHTLIKSHPGRKSIHAQKQRAIQTLTNSLIMAVIFYLPPVFLFAIGKPLINSLKVFVCTVAIPITITSTFGSGIMPMLYLNNLRKLDCFKLGCCSKS